MGGDHTGRTEQARESAGAGLEGGDVVSRSPKVSVRCIGPVFTEDERGARGSPGGPSLVGRGLKLEGEVKKGWVGGRGTLYIIYRDTVCTTCPASQCPPPASPGVSTCKPGFDPNHNRSSGRGGRAYCCKQGGSGWRYPLAPRFPSPCSAPGGGRPGASDLQLVSLGTTGEGTRGRERYGGREY